MGKNQSIDFMKVKNITIKFKKYQIEFTKNFIQLL